MADNNENAKQVEAHDIVFDCTHCGKNFEIDGRAAGMAIRCPACGGDIDVPIPEGVDISDIDRMGALDPREIAGGDEPARLPESREELRVLMTELEELRFRRRDLDKRYAAVLTELVAMQGQIGEIRSALDQLDDTLKRLLAPSSGDTQLLA